jgi:hypothetical protein
VISTVDRQARHTRKSKSKRRDGFRGHVAAEPETDLITGCEMTMAAGDGSTDAENGVKMACRDRFGGDSGGGDAGPGGTAETAAAGGEAGPAGGRDAGAPSGAGPASATGQAADTADQQHGQAPAGPPPGPPQHAPRQGTQDQAQPAGDLAGEGLEIYGDSAYGSGEARAAYRDAGHDTIIKPKPLRPAVDGGFTLDDFTIDEKRGTVTCPAGQVRPIAKSRTVTFGAACAACPLRARCTTARDGRSMTIHPHEGLLRAARAQARTGAFKQAYPTRSMIERVIAWTATCNGRRVRLRYIGTAKNDAWLHNRCAAINLRTLLRHGLTRRDGAWVLAGQPAPAAQPRRRSLRRPLRISPGRRQKPAWRAAAYSRCQNRISRPQGHPPDPGYSEAS